MSIPKSVRDSVWRIYNKNSLEGKCYVCGLTINYSNFQVGHNKAKANGGTDDISNLRPICSGCNGSMGTMNLEDFKKKHYSITTPPETPRIRKSVTEVKYSGEIIDNFRRKFEMHYSTNDIYEIFDTIRTIHMGIRYEAGLTDSQLKSINTLVQYNLINRFSYSMSEEGEKLARQLVEQYVDNNTETLNKILTKYSNKIIGCASYALIANSGSYRPSLYQETPMFKSSFRFNYNDEPFVNEKIIDKLNTFFSELITAKFAFKSVPRNSSGESYTCWEVLKRINEIANDPIQSIGKAIVTYRVIKTIEQFYKENQIGMPNTRTQLDAKIRSHNSSIEGIKKYLELSNKHEYTSKLNDDAPVIIVFDNNIGKLINETFTQIGKFIMDESYDTDLMLDDLYGMDYLAKTDRMRRL